MLAVAALVGVWGCASSRPPAGTPQPAPVQSVNPPTGPLSPPPPGNGSQANVGFPPAQDPRSVDEMANRMAAAENLEPVERDRLAACLRQADPGSWQFLLQYYRLGLAARRQPEQRDLAGRPANLPFSEPSLATQAGPKQLPPLSGNRREVASSTIVDPQVARASHTVPAPTPSLSEAGRESSDRAERAKEAASTRQTEIPPLQGNGITPQTSEAASKPGNSAPRLPTNANPADPSSPDAWRDHVAAAIAALESAARQSPQVAADPEKQARLRMLYIISGRRDDALRPITSVPPTVQDFCRQELYGLSVWLDEERVPDQTRRAGEARPQFAAAVSTIGGLRPW